VLDAEPGETLNNRFANGGRVLTDAGGEHEPVDAAHGGGEKACKQRDAIGEAIECQPGAGSRACEQFAHVVADAGQPLEAALVVKQALDIPGAHALLAHEVKDDAGV
jgi:hypothetical protein